MKKIICSLILAASFLAASAQHAKYTVTCNIEGAEGVQLLMQTIGGSVLTLGKGVIKDGTLVIKGGPVEYPLNVILITEDKKFRLSFYLENSDITITGKLAYLSDAEVTGSKTQDEVKLLSTSIFPASKKYSATVKEYEEAKKAGNETLAAEKIKQINESASEITRIQKEFITGHPASFAVPTLLRGLASSMSATELESAINSLDPAVAGTPIIVDLKSRIEILKRVEIGQKAPEFTQKDPSGNPVALSSLTGKNFLLIDFWAAWCNPCRGENPNVVKVYNEFRDKGFSILGVSLDRTAADWNKAIADDKLTWTHVSDLKYWNNSAARLYGVNSIPANFLLDKDGVIIAKNLRGEELYKKIKELLGDK